MRRRGPLQLRALSRALIVLLLTLYLCAPALAERRRQRARTPASHSWVCAWPSRAGGKVPDKVKQAAVQQYGKRKVDGWMVRKPGNRTRMPAKHELPRRILDSAVQECGLKAVALKHDVVKRFDTRYRCKVPWAKQDRTARNQVRSGRCWIFAGNVALESKVLARKRKNVELSASFVNYHALRKVSFGLLTQAARGKPVNPEDIQEVSEGGFGAWYFDIVKAHGAVPEQRFRSTYPADHSAIYLNRLRNITSRAVGQLQQVAGDGKGAKAQRTRIVKQAKTDIVRQLNTSLGRPPRRFTVNGKSYTPKTYLKNFLGLKGKDLDYVMVGNDPMTAFNRRYTVDGFPGMKPFEVHNISLASMRSTARKTLNKGEALYFSTIISAKNPHTAGRTKHDPKAAKGVLSLRAYDYGRLLPESSRRQSKRDRQKTEELRANHAMALVGHDTRSHKWLLQNSHGGKAGDKGQLHMHDDFFAYYGSSMAVPRSMVSNAVLKKTMKLPPMESPRKRKRDL